MLRREIILENGGVLTLAENPAGVLTLYFHNQTDHGRVDCVLDPQSLDLAVEMLSQARDQVAALGTPTRDRTGSQRTASAEPAPAP